MVSKTIFKITKQSFYRVVLSPDVRVVSPARVKMTGLMFIVLYDVRNRPIRIGFLSFLRRICKLLKLTNLGDYQKCPGLPTKIFLTPKVE